MKNIKLAELNFNLVEKDNTIFSLRGKILELNNILGLSEEKQMVLQEQITNLDQSLSGLESEKSSIQKKSAASIAVMELRSKETLLTPFSIALSGNSFTCAMFATFDIPLFLPILYGKRLISCKFHVIFQIFQT